MLPRFKIFDWSASQIFNFIVALWSGCQIILEALTSQSGHFLTKPLKISGFCAPCCLIEGISINLIYTQPLWKPTNAVSNWRDSLPQQAHPQEGHSALTPVIHPKCWIPSLNKSWFNVNPFTCSSLLLYYHHPQHLLLCQTASAPQQGLERVLKSTPEQKRHLNAWKLSSVTNKPLEY